MPDLYYFCQIYVDCQDVQSSVDFQSSCLTGQNTLNRFKMNEVFVFQSICSVNFSNLSALISALQYMTQTSIEGQESFFNCFLNDSVPPNFSSKSTSSLLHGTATPDAFLIFYFISFLLPFLSHVCFHCCLTYCLLPSSCHLPFVSPVTPPSALILFIVLLASGRWVH